MVVILHLFSQQPTTNNQQPTTNNQQPTTNNQLLFTLLPFLEQRLYPS